MSETKRDKLTDEILLDHNYDGIEELDNPLPRWWVWLFYLTIIFSVIYIWYYWFSSGKSIEESFQAKLSEVTTTQEVASSSFDLESFKVTDELLGKGEAAFASKCASCHRADAGGLIGPNLTDNHWIHGKGDRQSIFKVVKEGVPEKGMIAWGPLMSDEEIATVVLYVQSLKGSNPANAKAPEGQLVE